MGGEALREVGVWQPVYKFWDLSLRVAHQNSLGDSLYSSARGIHVLASPLQTALQHRILCCRPHNR